MVITEQTIMLWLPLLSQQVHVIETKVTLQYFKTVNHSIGNIEYYCLFNTGLDPALQ